MRSLIFLFLLVAAVSCAVVQLNTRHRRVSSRGHRKASVLAAGSTPVISGDQWQMSVDVAMGTPPQLISMDVDLTTEEFDLYNMMCFPNCTGASAVFDPAASSTFGCGSSGNNRNCINDISINQIYNGNVAHDVFSLAGVSVPQQPFLMYNIVGANGLNLGSLGLGIRFLNYGSSSILNNVQSQLDAKIFTVYINQNHNGLLTMGGVDGKNCHGGADIRYTPLVAPHSEWQIRMNEFSLGGYTSNVTGDVQMRLDTYEIAVPKAVFPYILRETQAKPSTHRVGYHVVDCATRESLPPLVFNFAGNQYVLESKYYTTGPLKELGGECGLAIFKYSSWQMGTAFLTPYCGIFDFGNFRIGLTPSLQS